MQNLTQKLVAYMQSANLQSEENWTSHPLENNDVCCLFANCLRVYRRDRKRRCQKTLQSTQRQYAWKNTQNHKQLLL